MQTYHTPTGHAGTSQLYGIEESINSHLEQMFDQVAKRSILEFGVGRTTSIGGGVDNKVRLHAQQRDRDAEITFHAGKALELSMQLVYAYGTDRIMGREYPGVSEKEIGKDVHRGHDLQGLYRRIVNDMPRIDVDNALEDAYQRAVHKGVSDVIVNGEHQWYEFMTEEDLPFRENAFRMLADGMELTDDHSDVTDLLFGRKGQSDFSKMPIDTFGLFLAKADAAYYERDIPDKQGKTKRRNMRWSDYSARDHEYGRPYAVAGIRFFARLVNYIVGVAKQQWLWEPGFALRWWERRQRNVLELMKNHAMQNFDDGIEFPRMMRPEQARDQHKQGYTDPAIAVKRGHDHLFSKREVTVESKNAAFPNGALVPSAQTD